MDKLLAILEEIEPGNDYASETRLIDDGLINSISLLTLVSELEDAFDIEILPADLIPANFNSARSMWAMIQRLQKER